MSALELSGITYVISRTLLDGIDLEFRAGEVTALSGPSGSGKTTLLSVAGGLLEATAGTASYAGRSMWLGTGDPRPEVAFVLQVYGLVPILSARENVSVALRARGVKPAEADERAEAALARFHIADLGDRQVEELSGGQMQRVACARGLVVGAEVLLADEPTSELDEGNRALVLAELRKEAERGSVVVVATHDPAVVDACDRHYVLDEGRLTDHVAAVDLRQFARAERRAIEEAAPPHFDDEPYLPEDARPAEPAPVAAEAAAAEVRPARTFESQTISLPRHRLPAADDPADDPANEPADDPVDDSVADDSAFRRPASAGPDPRNSGPSGSGPSDPA